jgi:hypothetical protein
VSRDVEDMIGSIRYWIRDDDIRQEFKASNDAMKNIYKTFLKPKSKTSTTKKTDMDTDIQSNEIISSLVVDLKIATTNNTIEESYENDRPNENDFEFNEDDLGVKICMLPPKEDRENIKKMKSNSKSISTATSEQVEK